MESYLEVLLQYQPFVQIVVMLLTTFVIIFTVVIIFCFFTATDFTDFIKAFRKNESVDSFDILLENIEYLKEEQDKVNKTVKGLSEDIKTLSHKISTDEKL